LGDFFDQESDFAVSLLDLDQEWLKSGVLPLDFGFLLGKCD